MIVLKLMLLIGLLALAIWLYAWFMAEITPDHRRERIYREYEAYKRRRK